MNPYARTRWTLIAALLIWAPIAMQMVNGGIELWFAGAMFLGALLLGYIGTGIIGHMTDGYAKTHHQVHMAKRQIEAIERRKAAENQNRRKDDGEDEPAGD